MKGLHHQVDKIWVLENQSLLRSLFLCLDSSPTFSYAPLYNTPPPPGPALNMGLKYDDFCKSQQ